MARDNVNDTTGMWDYVTKAMLAGGWKCADKRHWPREASLTYLVSHPAYGIMKLENAMGLLRGVK